MIRGLQITIRGEELGQRIAERIRMHGATINALDMRIKQREGDQPFDVRPEDASRLSASWRTSGSTNSVGVDKTA